MTAAALLMLTGVMAAAWGTHSLRQAMVPALVEMWRTAVLYQLVHGLGILLVCGLSMLLPTGRMLIRAAGIMLFATLVFSGSLYALVLTRAGWLATFTPVGGLLFLTSWTMVAISTWQARGRN